MKCVICDSPNLEEVRPAEIERLEEVSFSYSFSPTNSKTFRVVRCKSCTHLFCAPLPARVSESYQDVVDEEYLKHADSRRLSSEAVLRTIGSYASRSDSKSLRLLDVGCATGDFLEAGRRAGFDVEGLELSDWSCRIARARGLTVHQELLATFAERASARFDVISLIGVIEHFPDPRAEMRSLVKLLRPGGIIVLWTGDASSWLARVLGRRWWYWQGQHIQYFTHASLMHLTEREGLVHLKTTRYPFVATHTTIANSLRRYPFHRILAGALRPLFRAKPRVYLRLPGEMLFLARRT